MSSIENSMKLYAATWYGQLAEQLFGLVLITITLPVAGLFIICMLTIPNSRLCKLLRMIMNAVATFEKYILRHVCIRRHAI